jgi:hypothetical protein
VRLTAALVVLACLGVSGASRASPANRLDGGFVTRAGGHLVVDGRPFRFGGANVEWLGLVGYGPADASGPRYPSNFEIDDALDTVQELGATVVRSQTMGDSVGCALCIEPEPGRFNQKALERIDYGLKEARGRGIRIIPTIVGDDARAGGTGCVYLRWRSVAVSGCSLINMEPFWADAGVAADVERHIQEVLTHVNVYTGIAYKDDPTILGWDLLNGGGSPTPWTRRIARYVRSLDSRHLILSGPGNASVPEVDVCVAFVYPHWFQPLASIRPGIADCKAAGKPFVAYEYGWDRTNYATLHALRTFLATLERAPEVSGDAFWALQAHRDGHGWMPIPADTSDPTTARDGESGHWWALYYPGLQTMVNEASDMAARAQAIRRHNYVMAGIRVPRHRLPPAPTITSVDYGPTSFVGRVGVRVYWRGSAGAKDYTVQRAPSADGPWTTICRRCVTDVDDGFVDLSAASKDSWYRLIPYNLDGKAGPGSAARRA